MARHRILATAVIVLAGAGVDGGAVAQPTTQDQMMYFRAYVQDDPACTVAVAGGQATFPGIATPAATCPDAFAWAGLVSAISDRFWTMSQDVTVWPAVPKPLCAKPGDQGCCDPSVLDGPLPVPGAPDPACPYAPRDYTDPPVLTVVPTNRHTPAFVRDLDPGRALRDEEVELIFRNASMLRYIFEKNLYTKEGLGARFRALNGALSTNVPYHATGLEVRFPEDAVMIKADWVHQRDMLEAGLITAEGPGGQRLDPPQNPDFPYVTVFMQGGGATAEEREKNTGLYYLVAMTNASKALPGWHWYAIEHATNRGRCDFIGCNDSFGFAAKGAVLDGRTIGTNYVPPFPLTDPKTGQTTPTGYGQVYLPAVTGETMTPALKALFDGLGVGTAATDPDPNVLDPADPAWRNYRMKGTQTNFTTLDGVETIMGASVTEGGFVNSASCMSCHSQATTDANGNPGIAGIGSIARLNLFGYQQSSFGAPESTWFYQHGAAILDAVQIDFVWGILNANCVKNGTGGACASYADVVLSFPAD